MTDYAILTAFLSRYVLGCLIGLSVTLVLMGACWFAVRLVWVPHSERRRIRARLGLCRKHRR